MMILPRRWFSTSVDIPARTKSIADRVADGRLPRIEPETSRAGFGSGCACDGCGESILPSVVEEEHALTGGRTLRFHATCSQLWKRLIAPASG
jgi:hypothetical protein